MCRSSVIQCAESLHNLIVEFHDIGTVPRHLPLPLVCEYVTLEEETNQRIQLNSMETGEQWAAVCHSLLTRTGKQLSFNLQQGQLLRMEELLVLQYILHGDELNKMKWQDEWKRGIIPGFPLYLSVMQLSELVILLTAVLSHSSQNTNNYIIFLFPIRKLCRNVKEEEKYYNFPCNNF